MRVCLSHAECVRVERSVSIKLHCVQVVQRLRDGFHSHRALDRTRDRCYRLQQLRNLKKMLLENEKKIKEALYQDLQKV